MNNILFVGQLASAAGVVALSRDQSQLRQVVSYALAAGIVAIGLLSR